MERWKVIEGFENYMISNTGKVKSVRRVVRNNFCSREIPECIMSGSDNGKGYLKVNLFKDGKYHRKYIHRLVALHFLPNPLNKPCVNHIDNNPLNNNAENLEWCTHEENMRWARIQGRTSWNETKAMNHQKAQEKLYVSVVGENVKTGEKIYFAKLNDVRKLGFQPSCVCNCCKGKRGRTQHKGYRWSYEISITTL